MTSGASTALACLLALCALRFQHADDWLLYLYAVGGATISVLVVVRLGPAQLAGSIWGVHPRIFGSNPGLHGACADHFRTGYAGHHVYKSLDYLQPDTPTAHLLPIPEHRSNVACWPAIRVHPTRRKAAVEDSTVRSVARSSNWCYRPQPAVQRAGKPAVGMAALLRNLTDELRARFGHCGRWTTCYFEFQLFALPEDRTQARTVTSRARRIPNGLWMCGPIHPPIRKTSRVCDQRTIPLKPNRRNAETASHRPPMSASIRRT